jgi:hypothetical protein
VSLRIGIDLGGTKISWDWRSIVCREDRSRAAPTRRAVDYDETLTRRSRSLGGNQLESDWRCAGRHRANTPGTIRLTAVLVKNAKSRRGSSGGGGNDDFRMDVVGRCSTGPVRVANDCVTLLRHVGSAVDGAARGASVMFGVITRQPASAAASSLNGRGLSGGEPAIAGEWGHKSPAVDGCCRHARSAVLTAWQARVHRGRFFYSWSRMAADYKRRNRQSAFGRRRRLSSNAATR